MTPSIHQKVTPSHLRRDAYLYLRQSTVRQVFENTESTRRQYALRERAVALGWPVEWVQVIDSNQGKSGASSVDREGFQKLVGEVGMGRAGIVLGLEASRLARNATDWHRLLEICALTDTVILDEDGIYNPGDFNDRLLLGLKGTMSDAKLHMLRARLRGGILNQAGRGALKTSLPVGLVYDSAGNVVLDPDKQVRQSLVHLFETFECSGSATATVKYFREQGLRFPRRPRFGPHRGELLWEPLRHWRVLRVLHNPRYAGTYFFGRSRTRKRPGDSIEVKALPREEWIALLPDAHPGYIPWEQFEANLGRLRDNVQAHGFERRQSPPREGPALLQGQPEPGVDRSQKHASAIGTGVGEVKLGREGVGEKIWKHDAVCGILAGHRKTSICARSCLITVLLARGGFPVSHIRGLSGLGHPRGQCSGLAASRATKLQVCEQHDPLDSPGASWRSWRPSLAGLSSVHIDARSSPDATPWPIRQRIRVERPPTAGIQRRHHGEHVTTSRYPTPRRHLPHGYRATAVTVMLSQ